MGVSRPLSLSRFLPNAFINSSSFETYSVSNCTGITFCISFSESCSTLPAVKAETQKRSRHNKRLHRILYTTTTERGVDHEVHQSIRSIHSSDRRKRGCTCRCLSL